jgi:hypothetical protein
MKTRKQGLIKFRQALKSSLLSKLKDFLRLHPVYFQKQNCKIYIHIQINVLKFKYNLISLMVKHLYKVFVLFNVSIKGTNITNYRTYLQ